MRASLLAKGAVICCSSLSLAWLKTRMRQNATRSQLWLSEKDLLQSLLVTTTSC